MDAISLGIRPISDLREVLETAGGQITENKDPRAIADFARSWS